MDLLRRLIHVDSLYPILPESKSGFTRLTIPRFFVGLSLSQRD